MVKKRPTQPSVLQSFSPQGPFGNPDHYFFSLITSLTYLSDLSPARQAFIFGKRIPYISPQLIPILKASVSHSSSLDIERECVCPTQSVCFFSSSSCNNTSFSKERYPFFFSFHSSRLVSSRQERKPARPRRTGASDLVGLPLVSVRGNRLYLASK